MKPTAENDRYRSTVLNDNSAMAYPHSKLGIAACICSVLAWVLLVVLAMVPDWASLLGWSNGALALVFMLALLGMLLGLMCVFQLEVQKLFGKLGLMLGSVCAMCIGVLWWLAVYIGA